MAGRAAKATRAIATLAVLAALAGCKPEEAQDGAGTPVAEAPSADAIEAERRHTAVAELARWEQAQRALTDFAALPPWSEASGPNPFRVRAWPGPSVLGLLRGTGELLRMDAEGRELSRQPTLVDATGWDLVDDTLYVVSPRHGTLARYTVDLDSGALQPRDTVPVVDAFALRDVAVAADGTVALAEVFAHQVLVLRPLAADPSARPVFSAECGGALKLQWLADRLLALCSLDHRLLAWRLDAQGLPTGAPTTVEHDGPMWSMAAVALPDATIRVALGGVEDRALDRSDGAFGYIDSFVFVVDVPPEGPAARRAELNVSEHGVITPKWVQLSEAGDVLHTVGYGGDVLLRVQWNPQFDNPVIAATQVVPGITDMTPDGLAASPLLDAWVAVSEAGVSVRPVGAPDGRSAQVRLGEALMFTGLMGPSARTEGRASRFTCETCHFEGGVDGRVHWTGRGEVFAATRPLRGLFNNRPHFSRALDHTMADMVNNEFRVVSRGTGTDPWFSVSPTQTPWLTHLGVTEPVDAQGLRRALMAFIMTLTHEPNPRVLAGDIDPEAREAAELFERHCESCHAARLVSDDGSTRVAPAHWMDSILTPQGPIVWGTDTRVKTGVVPYVHPEGARVPSLRRVYAKRPYFTNGSALGLQEAARSFTVGVDQHVRDAAGGRPITERERRALQRFLELL